MYVAGEKIGQLIGIERLGQEGVTVMVRRLAERAHQYDRRGRKLRVCPELSRQLIAVHPWQAHVRDNEVRFDGVEGLQSALGVRRSQGIESHFPKDKRHEPQDWRLILNHQASRGRASISFHHPHILNLAYWKSTLGGNCTKALSLFQIR